MRALFLLLGVWFAGCSTINLGAALGDASAEPPGLPLDLLWERDADGAFGPSAAHVTDRFVVVGTRKGDVVVIDRDTGRIEGAGEFGDSVEGQLAVSPNGEVLYVPTVGGGGGVEAYDVRRGRRIWRWREGQVQAGVVRVGATLVVPLLDGRLAGLDVATGDVRWERASPTGVQFHAAPLAVGTDVIVSDDAGTVVRLRALDGAEQWRAEVGAPVYAPPTADVGAVYISTTRGDLARLDAGTGDVAWQVQDEEPLRVSSAAVGATGLAVGYSDGTVRGIDPTTGVERWRMQGDGNVTAQPVWIGDRVAVGTLDRQLLIVDGRTGREEWSTELRGRVKSALTVGSGLLVVLVEPRHVIAFHTAR